jgi:hypothetical protein
MFNAPDGYSRSSVIQGSILQRRPTVFSVSKFPATARLGQTRFYALSEVAASDFHGNSRVYGDYQGLNTLFSVSKLHPTTDPPQTGIFAGSEFVVSAFHGNSRVYGDHKGLNTVFSVSKLHPTTIIAQTHVLAISRSGISEMPGDTEVNEDYLGPTTLFSLSAIPVGDLCGNSDLIAISSCLTCSMLSAGTNEQPSGSSLSIQIGIGELKSTLSARVGGPGVPADAYSTQRESAAVALVAGLGAGILVLVVVASCVLFCLFKRRRDDTDDIQEDEFSDDSIGFPDTWVEGVEFGSCGNAMASMASGMEDHFLESEVVEEGLPLSPLAD